MAHISIIALSAFVALAGLHEGSAIPTVSLTARITVVSVRTESLILATPTSTSTSTPAMSLPTICLALVFSVFTSLLLVARFSPIGHDWRHATWASCFCWFIKVIISTVNIDVSGVILQDETYYDGLWRVVSDVSSGIILLLLLLPFFIEFLSLRKASNFTLGVRVSGRYFILETTLFIRVVGIERHRQDGRLADIQRGIQFLTDINECQDLKDQGQDFTLATLDS
ncbi:hypothetical protein FRB96_009701 [Tulasnella sp. 330]|nr:hypothetical protein FRB96_009701 [Tulasnella sp. 330]KAG8882194.1 hypothetical protein FRB97_008603 [Tulasnella sp. 331]